MWTKTVSQRERRRNRYTDKASKEHERNGASQREKRSNQDPDSATNEREKNGVYKL